MKKLLYVILSLLLCVGAIGGTVVVAKYLTDKIENEYVGTVEKGVIKK